METEIDFIGRKSSNLSSRSSRRVSEYEPATFEEAISETKYGKYNIMLAFLMFPASICAMFDTTSMSYTFVAAQCDLELSLADKGLLNAATYLGMISTAVVWGFLSDVLGRRKLLYWGFIVDGVFVFMSACSQNLTLLLISKFLQGSITNGPLAALSSYMSEFHSAEYRSNCQLVIGACVSFGNILLPLIAWAILPQNMDFSLIGMDLHSWNIFLLVTSLPAFLCGLIFIFLPESPKFLMACGENEKALAVFRKVYRMNTGQPEDTYPVKKLLDETKLHTDSKHGGKVTAQRTKTQALKEGFQQIKPIFFPPYLRKTLLTCLGSLFIIMGHNMLRLWLPQIFQIMTDYQLEHNGESASLCAMLESVQQPSKNITGATECFVNNDNSAVYINSIIVGSTSITGFAIAAILIGYFGKKTILISSLTIGGIDCIGLYFAKTPSVALALSAIFVAMGTLSSNVMISITVDIFPTTLRTLAIALTMMLGRIGAMFGNSIFPYLLEAGCEPPFFAIGSYMLAAALLSIFIPHMDNEGLK